MNSRTSRLNKFEPDKIDSRRRVLLDDIAADTADTVHMTGRKRLSDQVMDAISEVPRQEFVKPGDVALAYANRPLGIGHGQTISQPFVVALMSDLLELEDHHKVLEVGTGSGYQAAILSGLANQVYSTEIIPELAKSAQERLARLGCHNVDIRINNGRDGLPDQAPFDAIMVTAASPDIPPALVDQLAPGGRMIIPVGTQGGAQNLVLLIKSSNGKIIKKNVLPVSFVPLVS